MSLNDAANAKRPDRRGAYLDGFDSTRPSAGGAERDWLGLLEVGGNVYYTYKLAACDGLTFQDLAGHQTGMTRDEFAQMMLRAAAASRAPTARPAPGRPVTRRSDGEA